MSNELQDSEKVVQAFLDALPEEDKFNPVVGQVKEDLKEAVFDYLEPTQKIQFISEPREFDQWITDTLRKLRGYVIQPQKAGTTSKPLKKPGDANGLTKEAQRLKNQDPRIKKCKAKYEKDTRGSNKKGKNAEGK